MYINSFKTRTHSRKLQKTNKQKTKTNKQKQKKKKEEKKKKQRHINFQPCNMCTGISVTVLLLYLNIQKDNIT